MSIIIFKTRDFIIVIKPIFTPSQWDLSGEIDAMTMASGELKVCAQQTHRRRIIKTGAGWWNG